MQILKMHNLTQNYRINLAARGILQSHGTLRHMTVESNNGIIAKAKAEKLRLRSFYRQVSISIRARGPQLHATAKAKQLVSNWD